MALAQWITDTDHGAGNLLARVAVNRLWQHHMGRGIVATPNDFGVQGDPPTHPELLDYLAGELIRGGWKLKPLHKLIMTSAVYLQGDAAERREPGGRPGEQAVVAPPAAAAGSRGRARHACWPSAAACNRRCTAPAPWTKPARAAAST